MSIVEVAKEDVKNLKTTTRDKWWHLSDDYFLKFTYGKSKYYITGLDFYELIFSAKHSCAVVK